MIGDYGEVWCFFMDPSKRSGEVELRFLKRAFGLIAKRRNSRYEPGQRSGAWQKMRVNRRQELVIAGYTPSPKNFDALVIGYFEGPSLIYLAGTRNGFTPASRAELP